jgi:cation diffusion facilitator family transporter
MSLRARLLSPYVAMGVVIAMYAVKVALKLRIGSDIHSPTITADGFHNVADLVEALAVVVVVAVSRMPPDDRYPFGRKNLESLVRAAIGLGLCATALHFAATSLLGTARALGWESSLRAASPIALPWPETLQMGPDVLWAVMAVTGGSALLSFAVSAYEIRAGRLGGHGSMVADGEETFGDGLIESAIFAGVCAQYAFGAAWVEYPLGLGVAFIVARTGRELLSEGMSVLLQRSLGADVEKAIRETCLATHGTRGVEQAKTFRVGDGGVVILKILTDAPAAAHDDVKKALKARLAARLAELGIEGVEYHLRFSRLPVEDVRVAYAAVTDGETYAVASSIDAATGFIVCDLKRGEAVRWWFETLPPACEGRLEDWLAAKRITTLFVFGDRPAGRLGPALVRGVPSYGLGTLGLVGPPPDP